MVSTALEILKHYLENMTFDKTMDYKEIEYKLESLTRTLNSLKEQKEYFVEFWSTFKTELFTVDGHEEYDYTTNGQKIQNVILSKYDETIEKIENEIQLQNEELNKYKKIYEERERLKLAIKDIEILLNPKKVYKKVVTKKEPKECLHEVFDGYSNICIDCGKIYSL